MTYDEGSQEYTGRLDVVGDFDIKTLIIESGSSYGVNWTGEVSTSFENRIKFENKEINLEIFAFTIKKISMKILSATSDV